MVSFPLQLYLSCPSPTNSPCCYVPHMLWWLLFWKGEMIQTPGMHGRTAAGHCTCSSKKNHAEGCKFGQCMCMCVVCEWFNGCARTFLIHQIPSLLLATLLSVSRHFYLPAPFFPPLLFPHMQQKENWSLRCLEEQWALVMVLKFHPGIKTKQTNKTPWEP